MVWRPAARAARSTTVRSSRTCPGHDHAVAVAPFDADGSPDIAVTDLAATRAVGLAAVILVMLDRSPFFVDVTGDGRFSASYDARGRLRTVTVPPAMAFAAAATFLTAIIFGLLPALRASRVANSAQSTPSVPASRAASPAIAAMLARTPANHRDDVLAYLATGAAFIGRERRSQERAA